LRLFQYQFTELLLMYLNKLKAKEEEKNVINLKTLHYRFFTVKQDGI